MVKRVSCRGRQIIAAIYLRVRQAKLRGPVFRGGTVIVPADEIASLTGMPLDKNFVSRLESLYNSGFIVPAGYESNEKEALFWRARERSPEEVARLSALRKEPAPKYERDGNWRWREAWFRLTKRGEEEALVPVYGYQLWRLIRVREIVLTEFDKIPEKMEVNEARDYFAKDPIIGGNITARKIARMLVAMGWVRRREGKDLYLIKPDKPRAIESRDVARGRRLPSE